MIPENFGQAIPARCAELMDELEGTVSEERQVTLLLSLASPLFIMPHQILCGSRRLVLGDVAELSQQAKTDLRQPLHEACGCRRSPNEPFWWWLTELPSKPRHPDNFRQGKPELMTEESQDRARQMAGWFWLGHLRNALSHAGVVYLDESGSHQVEREVRMLAFVSEADHPGSGRYLVSQIEVDEFRAFVRTWAAWLRRRCCPRVYGGQLAA